MNAAIIRGASAAGVLLLAAAPLRADTIKVPQDFATIQEAVDAAVAEDIVSVGKGTYAENVVITTSGITLKGPKTAIINGRYLGNCITITTTDVSVEGLTIANGGGAPPVDGTPTGGISATGTGITLKKLTVQACESFGLQL